MAAMVWLMPGAERTQFHVITLMTWLIAVGGFTHIVAGSMEACLLVLAGDLGTVANARTVHSAGPDRKHDRRHRVVCPYLVCTIDGRDLVEAKPQLEELALILEATG